MRERIEAACLRARRNPSEVTVMAVTKSQSPETVRAAADLGLNLFGENRVQEAKIKIGLCPARLRWHMIGHLQSNKCRDAVHFFEMIQSVDSLALAREISKWAAQSAKTMPILLEVNIAGEASKFGYRPEQLLEELPQLNSLPKIEIHGLMTLAPWSPTPERARLVFRRLRELKEQCEQILAAPIPLLSMGMSGDYEVAIEEGANLVRLGSALFDPRATMRSETP
ncbi:MAG: YggS family pyridoxal phosphate-dependent enzyme [Candidatus Omnitrophica bacterium]|nr:YggS family pyridoxal phosphate-dependent enzyme [Candidatus Omnitrophota bacterium]